MSKERFEPQEILTKHKKSPAMSDASDIKLIEAVLQDLAHFRDLVAHAQIIYYRILTNNVQNTQLHR